MLNNLLKWLSPILSQVEELCKPNPKYTKGIAEQEMGFIRNKAVLVVQVILFSIFVLDIFLNKGPVVASLLRCLLCVLITLSLFASCKFHPQIFKVIYSLLCIISGPMVINQGEEGIHTAWITVHFVPLFVYTITGSPAHFIFQMAVNTVLVNTFYSSLMYDALVYMRPETFIRALTYSANLSIVFTVTLIMLTHHFTKQAYYRTSLAEKKKDESETQRTFLLGFSHEIRNLINSLTGNVKLAALESVSEKAKEFLTNAEVCGELLIHLINNILDTGKVELGELEINLAPTKTHNAFANIWSICSELIRRKNLKGYMKIQRTLPKSLMIDQCRLTQIFLNLIGNAIKFTDKGSVNISVQWINYVEKVDQACFEPHPYCDNDEDDEQDEGVFQRNQSFRHLTEDFITLNTTSKRIEPSYSRFASYSEKGILKVIISDSGCGMPCEETRKLFRKFAQVTSDDSKKKLGAGLGLFITKQLCQRMNGEIKVFSKKNEGTSFIFCIPCSVAQEETEQIRDISILRNVIRAQRLTAMIVDDDQFNHVVLQSFMTKLGIEVIDFATNGQEAYQKHLKQVAENNCHNIIAIDLDVPTLNGKELAYRIRRTESVKGLNPCFIAVISTNCTDSEIKECVEKHGRVKANAFLNKPTSIDELHKALGYYFGQRR